MEAKKEAAEYDIIRGLVKKLEQKEISEWKIEKNYQGNGMQYKTELGGFEVVLDDKLLDDDRPFLRWEMGVQVKKGEASALERTIAGKGSKDRGIRQVVQPLYDRLRRELPKYARAQTTDGKAYEELKDLVLN
ncbi:hypothetical protein KY362_01960 [Candidatus Woesearchaeota archaeon]|nr:hypothetical protein [Candidatus Woesearchaeota archaeon]